MMPGFRGVLKFFATVLSWLSLACGVVVLAMIGFGFFPPGDDHLVLCVVAGVLSGALISLSLALVDVRQSQARLSEDHDELKGALDSALGQVSATGDAFLKERGELGNITKQISEAKSVDVCGMSLRGNINDNYDAYQTMLARGGRCRFALVDPEGDSADIIAKKYDERFLGRSKDESLLLKVLTVMQWEFPQE